MPRRSPYPDLQIPKCNILSYLFGDGSSLPNKPIWIDAANPNHSLSLVQMLSWVKRFAVGLNRLRIPESRAVMVFCPNNLYIPMVYLAAAGSKRYFTGANPNYTISEVAYQMRTIEAAIVLIHPSLLKTGLAAAKEAGIPFNRIFQFSDTVVGRSPEGIDDWRTMLASEAESRNWQWDPLEGQAAVDQICAINFSSGTTGLPKGVCITHHSLVSNASQASFIKFDTEHSKTPREQEIWLSMLPMYHAFSQLWTINVAAKNGIPVYVMERFVFEDFLKYLERYHVTALQTVPPVVVMLSKRPEVSKYDLSSIEYILCGAAPLSKDVQNDVMKRLGCVIVQGWGMTETTALAIIIPGSKVDFTGSIGMCVPNTEAKLINETGQEIAGNETAGELLVRGPQIMKEYWGNVKATKESLDDGNWLHTGDIAIRRGDNFWIVDRIKELIKVNGLQVAPAELEGLLLEHNDVADAAVVGITVHGEEMPRAYVVLQDTATGSVTEADIQGFVAGKVAKHKRLTGGVKFVEEVPKLPSGKIVRKLMREWSKRDVTEVEKQVKARL